MNGADQENFISTGNTLTRTPVGPSGSRTQGQNTETPRSSDLFDVERDDETQVQGGGTSESPSFSDGGHTKIRNPARKLLFEDFEASFSGEHLNQLYSKKMTPPTGEPAAQPIKVSNAVDFVREFDGKDGTLSDFMYDIKDAKSMIPEADELNLVKLIIIGKLKGEAKKAFRGKDIKSVAELEASLKEMFSPPSNTARLLGELGKEFQREGENVLTYSNRMRDHELRILETQGGTPAESFTSALEENLVTCFRNGLKQEIADKLPNFATLAENITNAIVAEKEINARASLRGLGLSHNRNVNAVAEPIASGPSRSPCGYCGMTNHPIEKCFRKEREERSSGAPKCQLCNRLGHLASACHTSQVCQLCGQNGHIAKGCKTARMSAVTCQFCDRPGHSAADCFKLKGGPAAAQSIRCHYCKQIGHRKDGCPKRMLANTKNYQGGSGANVIPAQPNQTRSANCVQEEKSADELLLQLITMEP